MKLRDLLVYLTAYQLAHADTDLEVWFEGEDGNRQRVGGLKIEVGSIAWEHEDQPSFSARFVPTTITLTP